MSSSGSELRGFVFAVVFIIIFATLLSSVPAGLQGPDDDPDTVIPIDPNILSGFAESENYSRASFTPLGMGVYEYAYTLGVRDWISLADDTTINLAAKDYVVGVFWLGHVDICEFIASSTKVDRGSALSLDEINADAEAGTIRYSLRFINTGNDAGSFIVYWNTTAYSNVYDAWDAENLYFLHGIGIENTATADIGALLVSLLFLRLPEVPPLVNLFLAVPIWACIVYVLWYIIKEMIPFV